MAGYATPYYQPYYQPQQPTYYPASGAAPDTLTQYKGQYQPQPVQQMPQQIPMPQPQNDMIWVLGEVEATSYPVAPNGTVVLWDKDQPTVFIKSVSPQGVPSIRILDYTERSAATPKPAAHECQCGGKYASIEAFEALEAQMRDIESRLDALAKAKTKPTKTAKEDADNA